jgi:cell wall-associated NlpC family hydrolase
VTVSTDIGGLDDVAANVAAIQARLAQLFAAAPPAGTGGTAAQGSTFAQTLSTLAADQAQGTGGTPVGSGGLLGSPAPAYSTTGAQVVADAERYLGVPYVWGGTDPSQGLDCSGLVQRVYADLGVALPRVSQDQAHAGSPVASLSQARPGDLVAFGDPATHIGIYAGNGMMVEAPRPGLAVRLAPLPGPPSAIRRILPDPGSAGTGAGPVPYASLFTTSGARYGVSPTLLAAVAKVESGFDPTAVSSAGATGLMQLMPATASGLGVDPKDPAQAVDGAARLLASDLQSLGSVDLALAAYNAGGGAVRRYGGIPPYPQTQAYVEKVHTAMTQVTL